MRRIVVYATLLLSIMQVGSFATSAYVNRSHVQYLIIHNEVLNDAWVEVVWNTITPHYAFALDGSQAADFMFAILSKYTYPGVTNAFFDIYVDADQPVHGLPRLTAISIMGES